MSIELVMPGNLLSSVIPFPSCLQSFPASRSFLMSQLFFCIRWPSSGFSIISSSNEYSGRISFRMKWFDILAVQGILKSILQHHSSKASVLQCSAFFIVQLSLPYMSTGKTTDLTRWTFVSKVISPLFNMLSRLVIAFLLRNMCLFNFMVAVTICSDFGALKTKSLTVSPSICHEVMGPGAISSFLNIVLSQLFHSPLSLSSRSYFSSSSLSAIRVVSSAYLRLLIFLPEVLIPAGASSSRAICMMYSA